MEDLEKILSNMSTVELEDRFHLLISQMNFSDEKMKEIELIQHILSSRKEQ